jgi:hypothetical protein
MNWMQAAATRIDATSVSQYIQNAAWVVPSVQTIHILGIGVVLTCASMCNATFAGLIGREEPLQLSARRYMPPMWKALAVLVLTGLILVVGEPHRELENQLFLLKMLLVVLAVSGTAMARRYIPSMHYTQLSSKARWTLSGFAVLSTLVWLLIICCGRWIAYVDVLGK